MATQSKSTRSKSKSKSSRSDAKSKPANRKKAKGNPFHQRLASLTYYQACQLLGEQGPELLRESNRAFEIDSEEDVFLGGDLYRVRFHDSDVPGGRAIATFTLQSARSKQLQPNCDQCETACVHLAAALSHLLEAKSVLGLAAPPDESVPLENLTHDELRERALAERRQRAVEEPMMVRTTDSSKPWTDYVVTSKTSGKSYRVALRGTEPGQSYCSCPDFRTNSLGTCKHVFHVLEKISRRFKKSELATPYQRNNLSLRLHYGDDFGLRFNLPTKLDPTVEEIVDQAGEQSLRDGQEAMRRIEALEHAGHPVHLYPDAEDYLQRALVQKHLQSQCDEIRRNPAKHSLRTELLDAKLLPYQLDGIAFAVGAGRAILADDMGLGKTIQGIGTAELLARLADIKRVLVICPASLKSQWRSEIERFSGRSVQIVLGTGAERAEQYRSNAFFTICNYEQVLRDLTAMESTPWDLIILDEGQRIKNWESKTSNMIRTLQSPYRLVLSGTPLENNLGELFTVARFVDEQRLGPAYQFFHRHRVVDEKGKTLGYQRLDQLRETMQPILLRRTRAEVAKQLPERTDEIVRIVPTAEQLEIHDSNMKVVAQITAKKFLTEIDMLRLRRALAMARMVADSTYLIDQQDQEYSSKLERLGELLEGLIADPTRKIVLFSEWRRMLDRVERRLDQIGCDFVRLDGKVPQKKRAAIVAQFQNDPECRVILMTNAGSTGLNLQSANTVINVDLPWNPAVLEQRIARAHRMGQKNPVHVYKLVTTGTIEEKLLDTLASKQDLANASLDMQSDVESVELFSGMEELKRRLEQIIGPTLTAPVDQSQQRRVEAETEALRQRREKVSAASGQLVGAALALAGELINKPGDTPPSSETVDRLSERLSECVETDSQGRPQLTISLPDNDALRGLAMTLARLLEA
ncbi:DEAD/DEAH box helicase [Novipirellula caenicola]|uniref:RNA polymerase-associated protein RapA n=1 Tax=Novipirellula caenicola TaxID=1536901 RepID=A0ABP9VQD7_9BACT